MVIIFNLDIAPHRPSKCFRLILVLHSKHTGVKAYNFTIVFLQVYGLDINPRAVKISWINLYLNALDDNGLPVYDDEKKTLLDRVEFYESDLLGYCRDNKIQLERIVGCIPQVVFSFWSPITYMCRSLNF